MVNKTLKFLPRLSGAPPFLHPTWYGISGLSLVGLVCITLPPDAAAAAPCTVPGTWVNSSNGAITVANSLTGNVKFPYCSAQHNLTVALNGTNAFGVTGVYLGGADCQGFAWAMTFAPSCVRTDGTFRNNDGGTGTDFWSKTGPFIALSRTSLTTASATGTPLGGSFAYTTTPEAGGNFATVAMADGVTASTNPNITKFTAPAGGGAPSPGGLEKLVAKYTANAVEASNDLNHIATFGMSCYMVALESDYGSGPNNCQATTIYGTRYTGTLTNPNGLTGTFCASFIANVRLQGTGQLNSGSYINYSPATRTMTTVTSVTGADGSAVVAGRTVARDRAIIPGRGVLVDVSGVGTGLLANDTGGAIRGYRLDLFNGAGRVACAGYANPIGVGVCQTSQAACPGSTFQ